MAVKERKARKYDPDITPIKAYELYRSGLKTAQVAHALGVTHVQFRKWIVKFPALSYAVKQAKQFRKGTATGAFLDYVYNRLSPEAQECWNKIKKWDDEKDGYWKIQEMLKNKGVRVRQHLFLQALVTANFNASEACRLLGINKKSLTDWQRHDPEFKKLFDEFHWHKGNFFEGALVGLVRQGDVAATIFANRTFNRDRGYNDKVEVQVNKKVEHTITFLNKMPLEVRKEMLRAMREAKEEQKLLENKNVGAIDAEFTVKEGTKT